MQNDNAPKPEALEEAKKAAGCCGYNHAQVMLEQHLENGRAMDVLSPPGQGMDPREVQNRRDMVEYLGQSLSGEYRTPVGDDEVRSTSTYLKSYIVEKHSAVEEPLLGWRSLGFVQVTRLDDATLFRATDHSDATYFIDARNPRFQIVHSIDRADQTDRTMERVTAGESTGFDRAWMPANFLKAQSRGRLTGFTFRFESVAAHLIRTDSDYVDPDTGEIRSVGSKGTRTSMKISEDANAAAEYSLLLESRAFKGRKALEQIEFRTADLEQPEFYAVSSVYSWGKIVAQGTWIGGHLSTVDRITRNYEQVIAEIEADYAIGWKRANGSYAHSGRPLEFCLRSDARIRDIEGFVDVLLRQTKPFRLFGIVQRISEERFDVAAIDLHSGDPLSLEISPEWIRAYLPIGSCGNVIARLYANLQHAVYSDFALAQDGSGDPFQDMAVGLR